MGMILGMAIMNIIKKGESTFRKGEATLKDVVNQSSEEENLYVLSAGTKGGDHTQLLLNGKLEPLFEELSTIYDYVIMDSGPLSLVSEANLLSEYSDVNLLVIRHAVTPKKIIQRLAHNQKSEILENMVIVFNGIKKRGFVKETSGYGYGYNQVYGYDTENNKG
jgi:Mrp family chromosome partitioning ATPase